MAREVRAERLWNQQTPRLGTRSAVWPGGATDPQSRRLLVCKGVTERQRWEAGREGDGSPAHSKEMRRAFCGDSHLWLRGQNIRRKPQKPYKLARALRPKPPARFHREESREDATHTGHPRGLPPCPPFPGPAHRPDAWDRTQGDPEKDTHAVGTGAGPGLGGRLAPSSGPRLAS